MGLHDRNGGTPKNYMRVRIIQAHPGYVNNITEQTVDNDLALITLAEPVSAALRGKGAARRINLPPDSASNPKQGSRLMAVGWGRTNVHNQRLPETLQGAYLNVINRTECERRLGREMAWKKLCVDNTDASTCQVLNY